MKKLITALGFMLVGATSFGQHTFLFDTYNTNDAVSEEISDTYILEECRNYSIKVEGHYSTIANQGWETQLCGSPESWPQFPSGGIFNGATGNDFEYVFADIDPANCGTIPYLNSSIEVSYDGGGNWSHPAVTPATYNSAHVYEFSAGTGQGFPLIVRNTDPVNSDNYGKLRFTITELNAMSACSVSPKFGSGQVGCGVQFFDISTLPCPQHKIMGVLYDFGDGTTSKEWNPTHSYTASGLYTVEYTIWITNGIECCKRTFTGTIRADACDPCRDVLPFAQIGISSVPGDGIKFSEKELANLNIADLDIGYSWNFGDGTYATGKSIDHFYANSGYYTVQLTLFYYNEVSQRCCSHTVSFDLLMGRQKRVSNDNGGKLEKSFERLEPNGSISIVPNPSNGEFTASLKDENISSAEIYNQAGALVLKVDNIQELNALRIDLSAKGAGVYFIVAQSASGNAYNGKIIVQ